MRNGRDSLLMTVLALWLAGCSTLPYSGARFHPDSYQVRPGETLYSIAWRFDLNYRNLARWNNISPPYTIYPGQRLRMNPLAGQRYASRSVPAPARHASPQSQRPTPRTQVAKASPSVPPSARVGRWIWPARGKLIKGYSASAGGNHGIDIAGRLGEPVVAAAGGTVVYSGDGLPSYGNLLIIQQNARYLTAYAHNAKLLVHEGNVVKQGQQIATMGRSGTNIHRPMLHFEIRRDGNPVDPLRYLPRQHK